MILALNARYMKAPVTSLGLVLVGASSLFGNPSPQARLSEPRPGGGESLVGLVEMPSPPKEIPLPSQPRATRGSGYNTTRGNVQDDEAELPRRESTEADREIPAIYNIEVPQLYNNAFHAVNIVVSITGRGVSTGPISHMDWVGEMERGMNAGVDRLAATTWSMARDAGINYRAGLRGEIEQIRLAVHRFAAACRGLRDRTSTTVGDALVEIISAQEDMDAALDRIGAAFPDGRGPMGEFEF
ncbi:uncharacterized protein DNG_07885 [Cephalotrichum gorgonifer]|uniref:Uncharacterized protein n=1 Tax=Cephalotrichum gorgonifer TaxID=2041049 RepID=A0AAE8N4A1_9PEZI|nr:uncharacterized protein DNG_07885 [Cephalotrichum gorgonifer]